MTKCKWKLGFYLWAALLFTTLPCQAQTQEVFDFEYSGSNKVVKEELDNFVAAVSSADADARNNLAKQREEFKQKRTEAYWKYREAQFQFNLYWAMAQVEVSAAKAQETGQTVAENTLNAIKNSFSFLGNVFTGEFDKALGNLGEIAKSSLSNIKTVVSNAAQHAWRVIKQANQGILETAVNIQNMVTMYKTEVDTNYANTKYAQQLYELLDAMQAAANEYIDYDQQYAGIGDVDNIGNLFVYTDSNGNKTYFTYDEKNAKTVAGTTRGCIPLPLKLAEGKSCIFCPLFLKIFNAANTMATQSYGILAISLANVMLIGFAIWIAFSVLGKVSSFTKMDAPKYITELLTQVFKVLLAYLLLRDANAIYTYALGPLLKAGMEFGMTLLAGSNKYLTACNSLGVKEMPLTGLLPSYLYVQLECFIQAVQAELAVPQSIGSSLMCVAQNAGGRDLGAITDITNFRLPDFSMLLEGLIIWVFAWLLALAFAFYLIDATVRLGIVGALMPFLIACWPFKVTSKYTSQGFTMFMNTFFTYAFMGLVVSINIQLISASMTGVKGGMDAVQDALNGNQVGVLKDLLDIGFSGFLILIVCSIFGFKLCGQAAELAGSMAGGGGGSSIAPKIGTLGYQAASTLALGTAKKVGQGAKLAGSFVGTATGITEKVRKGRDKVVGKMQNFFSFGRSGGGSSAPTSRVRGGSGSPAPQGAPSASDNNTPISADQRQQADNVSNAGPRSAQGQRADNAGRQNANAQQRQQSNNMQGQQPHGASGQQHSGNAQDQQHGSNSQQQARQTQDQNEADRQRRIDEHNRTMAATADVAASVAGKEIQTRRDEAAQKSRAAAERARVFESNAKAELEAAAELRKKAQAAATETERNDLSRQAQQAEDRAQHNTQAAQSERRTEKEQDKKLINAARRCTAKGTEKNKIGRLSKRP